MGGIYGCVSAYGYVLGAKTGGEWTDGLQYIEWGYD